MKKTPRQKIKLLKEALELATKTLMEYADKDKWGYFDPSGCFKGSGEYEEACILGRENAITTLNKINILIDEVDEDE